MRDCSVCQLNRTAPAVDPRCTNSSASAWRSTIRWTTCKGSGKFTRTCPRAESAALQVLARKPKKAIPAKSIVQRRDLTMLSMANKQRKSQTSS